MDLGAGVDLGAGFWEPRPSRLINSGSVPISRLIAAMALASLGVASVIEIPARPARPVRPIRCT